MKLSEIKVGERVRVTRLNGEVQTCAKEVGLTVGTKISVVGRNPLLKGVAAETEWGILGIRESTAEKIEVEYV